MVMNLLLFSLCGIVMHVIPFCVWIDLFWPSALVLAIVCAVVMPCVAVSCSDTLASWLSWSNGYITSQELMWFKITCDGAGSVLSKNPFLTTSAYFWCSLFMREYFSLCSGI